MSDGESAIRLRAGVMVRVVNPRSEHYGNTGHIIGRSEQREGFWLVRFTTTGDSVLLVAQELEIVTPSVRGSADSHGPAVPL
jgi:hypothetical protein